MFTKGRRLLIFSLSILSLLAFSEDSEKTTAARFAKPDSVVSEVETNIIKDSGSDGPEYFVVERLHTSYWASASPKTALVRSSRRFDWIGKSIVIFTPEGPKAIVVRALEVSTPMQGSTLARIHKVIGDELDENGEFKVKGRHARSRAEIEVPISGQNRILQLQSPSEQRISKMVQKDTSPGIPVQRSHGDCGRKITGS